MKFTRKLPSHLQFVVLLLMMSVSPTVGQISEHSSGPPSVDLPADLERVLRDYEEAWQARDERGLAALFTADGFVMSPGRPPVRGKENIQRRYENSGGPLALRALAFSIEGSVGYIIGAYGREPGGPDVGKFILALRKGDDGRWLIDADMDNGNTR